MTDSSLQDEHVLYGEPIHQGQVVVNRDVEATSATIMQDDDATIPLLPLAVENQAAADTTAGNGANNTAGPNADRGWACAFKLNVLVTIVAAVCFGTMAIEALVNDSFSGEGRRRLMHHHEHMDTSHHHDQNQHHDHGHSNKEGGHVLSDFILGGVAMVTIASLVAAGMLHSLFRCGRGFLYASYASFVGITGVAAVVFLILSSPVAAIVLGAVSAFSLMALRRSKHRIAFGAANLKVASLAIKEMPWTYISAVLMGVVQFLWCLVAAIAALGSFLALEYVSAPDGSSYRATECLNLDFRDRKDGISSVGPSCTCNGAKISDDECQFSGFGLPLTIVWLFSMAWGCAVIRNVVACTISGSVASWWFTPEEDTTPVKGAFHRATHSSFGSLCKAAIVQQFLGLVYQIALRVLRFVPCAATLLAWVDRAVRYALAYAVTFIGVYGLSFKEAGGRVHELFQKRGLTTLANDVVIEAGLRLLALTAIVVYTLSTGVMMIGAFLHVGGADLFDDEKADDVVDSVEFWSVVGPQIFGVVTLAFMVSTLLEVVRSGHKVVFVCFVQDPEMLAAKHGEELHAELHSAWQKMHEHHGAAPAIEGRSSTLA